MGVVFVVWNFKDSKGLGVVGFVLLGLISVSKWCPLGLYKVEGIEGICWNVSVECLTELEFDFYL